MESLLGPALALLALLTGITRAGYPLVAGVSPVRSANLSTRSLAGQGFTHRGVDSGPALRNLNLALDRLR